MGALHISTWSLLMVSTFQHDLYCKFVFFSFRIHLLCMSRGIQRASLRMSHVRGVSIEIPGTLGLFAGRNQFFNLFKILSFKLVLSQLCFILTSNQVFTHDSELITRTIFVQRTSSYRKPLQSRSVPMLTPLISMPAFVSFQMQRFFQANIATSALVRLCRRHTEMQHYRTIAKKLLPTLPVSQMSADCHESEW